MDRERREALIARYREGYDVIVAALDGATEAEMAAREAPGEWSPREVVHHLADSEMTSAIRLRRMLVEDDAVLVGYDQEAFARMLHYDRPIEPSLQAFRFARASTADILDRLDEKDWARAGTHSETGRYAITDWLEGYAAHAHDHADQIHRARATVTG